MNERQMEIIISRGIELVLGEGYQLKAQQVGVGTGRLDLLVSQPIGTRMVVELKKGRLARKHIDQVKEYAETLSLDAQIEVDSMIISNTAGPRITEFARSAGVRIQTISESRLSEIGKCIGLVESDLLGDRRKSGVLFGGGSGLRTAVPIRHALKDCPDSVQLMVKSQESSYPDLRLCAGTSQIVLHYKGIKVGGLNRWERGGHTYIATGVVLSDAHRELLICNHFLRMSRNTTGKHDHIWWERRWLGNDHIRQSEYVFRYFFNVIDEVLNSG